MAVEPEGMTAPRRRVWGAGAVLVLAAIVVAGRASAQVTLPVPMDQRGTADAERSGFHDAANIRTVFWNYGMVGDYPLDPVNVDLSVFHSAEVPKGTGMNYSDGITPFVLAKIRQRNGLDAYIMETGFRERQGTSPYFNRVMRFEPRPGYFQADPLRNQARSPALSSDPRTWPDSWPDKLLDPEDPGWPGSWNGYFGKRAAADQESYTVLDDQYYDAWDYYPDSRDQTRRGLGLRIEVRGFQWANPQAGNVIFWHYDITNESTTDYDDNIVFGLYMDSGVGGSALSCDGIYESDDDNAFFDRKFDQDVINLVYTWDRYGHGRDLAGPCAKTGYLGYAFLETPGNAFDGVDNDEDGITDEVRDGGKGELIVGQEAIEAWVNTHYDRTRFEIEYGSLTDRAGYRTGRWYTGDEDMDWNAELHDVGADGLAETGDQGEGDGEPTLGEPSFDRTDLNESDQIGLTGFKMNRIKAGQGNPNQEVDGILFYTETSNWPQRLYEKFTDPDSTVRFDPPLASNYNIGFLFASGPFELRAGKTERFSLALAYGGDLNELRRTVRTVQQIYDANYQFAVPPKRPTLVAEAGDGAVTLAWDDVAERGADPVTGEFDFEGYRIYRATDPEFRDVKVITTGTGSGPIGNGRPIVQFDLDNGWLGFSEQTVEGVAYYLGNETGIKHTWRDTTAVNGQTYYYAVTAYDHGSQRFGFYPSENAITVSRTPRGGTILPPNVVEVRAEPRVRGYVRATIQELRQATGGGSGTVRVEVLNSALATGGHLFKIAFESHPDSIRAARYALVDSTKSEVLFALGRDLEGVGSGPVGAGMLPVIATPRTIAVDSARTGFRPDSPTNAVMTGEYQTVLPINLRRPGYPDSLTITFADVVLDTGLAIFPIPARVAKFRVVAHTGSGDMPMNFRFRDLDLDGTLSRTDEYMDVVTYLPELPATPQVTWRFQVQSATRDEAALRPPAAGDVYDLVLTRPFGREDIFLFTVQGEYVDFDQARAAPNRPYVVPNPYVASASFEPERFNIAGRGQRHLEFRNVPQNCTIRIFNLRGELVRTLVHDGSTAGVVGWDLRTKDNLDVAPGLYIFHVEAGAVESSIGKFAIIK